MLFLYLFFDRCPEWPGKQEPSSEQLRAYGAAFKRAVRSDALYPIALKSFKETFPEMDDAAMDDCLKRESKSISTAAAAVTICKDLELTASFDMLYSSTF